MNTIAARASLVKDFQLAQMRYIAVMSFICECVEQNASMLTAGWYFDDNVEEKLDVQCFHAEIGVTKSCIGLADWNEAAVHIRVVMKDLKERPGISEKMKMGAKGLEQRIKKKLGTAYDKAKSSEEPTLKGSMAGLSLEDQHKRKDDKAGGR
jgi:hypothetical protein